MEFFYLEWIVVAAIIGFLISYVFAGLLQLRRNIYLIPYLGMVSVFLFAFIRWNGLSVGNLIRVNWYWGVIGAILLTVVMVRNIQSQPSSSRSTGFKLVFEIIWAGVFYGLVDSLLLSVLPVYATLGAFSSLNWTLTWPGKLFAGVLALVAGLLVTAAYHLGYPEYRGRGMIGPIIGSTAMILGYLVTGSPLAAILSRIAMHIAGVLHGPDSVIQLPLHNPE